MDKKQAIVEVLRMKPSTCVHTVAEYCNRVHNLGVRIPKDDFPYDLEEGSEEDNKLKEQAKKLALRLYKKGKVKKEIEDGDVVLLERFGQHHLGVVIFVDGKWKFLHSTRKLKGVYERPKLERWSGVKKFYKIVRIYEPRKEYNFKIKEIDHEVPGGPAAIVGAFLSAAVSAAGLSGVGLFFANLAIAAVSYAIGVLTFQKPKQPVRDRNNREAPRNFSSTGTDNQARINGAMAVVCGRMRMVADLAIRGYSRFVTNNEQIVSQGYHFGINDIAYEEGTIKIGDNPASNYSQLDAVTLSGAMLPFTGNALLGPIGTNLFVLNSGLLYTGQALLNPTSPLPIMSPDDTTESYGYSTRRLEELGTIIRIQNPYTDLRFSVPEGFWVVQNYMPYANTQGGTRVLDEANAYTLHPQIANELINDGFVQETRVIQRQANFTRTPGQETPTVEYEDITCTVLVVPNGAGGPTGILNTHISLLEEIQQTTWWGRGDGVSAAPTGRIRGIISSRAGAPRAFYQDVDVVSGQRLVDTTHKVRTFRSMDGIRRFEIDLAARVGRINNDASYSDESVRVNFRLAANNNPVAPENDSEYENVDFVFQTGVSGGSITITNDNPTNPVRRTYTTNTLPVAEFYHLSFDRHEPPSTDNQVTDDLEVFQIKAFQNEGENFAPDYSYQNRIGVVYQASEDLSGRIESVNAIIQGLAQIPQGTGNSRAFGGDKVATSNPAAWFRELLIGKKDTDGRLVYGLGYKDEEIDNESLLAFYDYCEDDSSRGFKYQFNGIIDSTDSPLDILRQVAYAGNGIFTNIAGKPGVYIDRTNQTPSSSFDESDIIEGSLELNFELENRTDEIEYSYINRNNEFEEETAFEVVAPGDNPEIINLEQIDLLGITSQEEAEDYVARLKRQYQYQNDVYKFAVSGLNIHIENGDTIEVRHRKVRGVSRPFRLKVRQTRWEGVERLILTCVRDEGFDIRIGRLR